MLRRLVLIPLFVIGLPLLVAWAAVYWPESGPPQPPPRAERLLLRNVHVVDVRTGTVQRDRALLLEGGRIAAVLDATVETPAATSAYDGSGSFLIPGLWDMHVHMGTPLADRLTLPLFIATGVTGVRDMGGDVNIAAKKRFHRDALDGQLVGPRFVTPPARMVFSLPSSAAAESFVELVAEQGGFVKTFNQVLPEPYFALTRAARERGVEVVGHRPRAVAAIDAVEAGHRSFEHARLLLFECFPGAAELRERYARRYRGEDEGQERIDGPALLRRTVDEHDPALCDALFAAMVQHQSWFVPTHVTRRMDARADDPDFRNDPRYRYVTAARRWAWKRDADGMIEQDPSPQGRQTFRDFYAKGLELTGRAHRSGVRILAGSDANDTFCPPGFSLHDELGELVRAGLSPLQALQAATLHAAEFAQALDDHGTVEVGKRADLLLLRANPLERIEHTAEITAVVFDGRLFDRASLDALLEGIEAAAGNWRTSAKEAWLDR